MKRLFALAMIIIAVARFSSPATGHSVHYLVENKGISIRVFYFVTFLPDRQGKWTIKVYGESEHGLHGSRVKVQVDDMESSS